jgi:hypothetical protein
MCVPNSFDSGHFDSGQHGARIDHIQSRLRVQILPVSSETERERRERKREREIDKDSDRERWSSYRPGENEPRRVQLNSRTDSKSPLPSAKGTT